MLIDKGYRERWERKQAWYCSKGIVPLAEADDRIQNLVVSEDTKDGAFSVPQIDTLIRKIKNHTIGGS